jgi:hypothetical protein
MWNFVFHSKGRTQINGVKNIWFQEGSGSRRLHSEELRNWLVRFTKYLYGDQMKESEIDWTRSMRGRWKCIHNFGRKTWREDNRSEDLGVDGRIILELILFK